MGLIPDGAFKIFSFWPHYSPGIHSTCNRNVYQGYALEGERRPMRRADSPNDLHVPIIWKFWNPRPPGALKAYPGLQWGSFALFMPIMLSRIQKPL